MAKIKVFTNTPLDGNYVYSAAPVASNLDPLTLSNIPDPGVSTELSRADHVHPIDIHGYFIVAEARILSGASPSFINSLGFTSITNDTGGIKITFTDTRPDNEYGVVVTSMTTAPISYSVSSSEVTTTDFIIRAFTTIDGNAVDLSSATVQFSLIVTAEN